MISGNLFTRDYLLEGITRSEPWRTLADGELAALKTAISKHAKSLLAINNPNEAQTEKTLIYPVLELLGWTDVEVQQTLSAKGRKQVPDALLFADKASRDRAVGEKDQWKRYQHGLAIGEAKRWRRALDRSDKRDPGEDGVPSTQMLQYLSRVDVQTSGKVRLGILTNGEKWRLYWQGALSVSEDFFEIDLAKALELPGHERDLVERADERLTPAHALKLFVLLFRKQAFLPLDGVRTFHDIAREEGKEWVGTAAALWGITAGVYLALMGPRGMAELGAGILQRSRYAIQRLSAVPGVRVPFAATPCFKEFVVNVDGTGRSVPAINKALLARGIFGGKDLSAAFPELGQSLLVCVTEVHTQADLDTLAQALAEVTR